MRKLLIFLNAMLLFSATIISPELVKSINFFGEIISFKYFNSVMIITFNVLLILISALLNKKLVIPRIVKYLLMFISYLVLISVFTSSIPTGASFWAIIVFCVPILNLLAVTQLIKNMKDVRLVLNILVFIAFLHASQALFSSIINVDISRLTTRIGGTGPLSNLLMLISPIALIQFIKCRNNLIKVFVAIEYIVIITALILTFSRLPIVIAVVINGVLTIKLNKSNNKEFLKFKYKHILIFSVLFLFSIGLITVIAVNTSFNFSYIFRLNDSGDIQRKIFFETSIELIKDHFFFGSGWGLFSMRGFNSILNYSFPSDPHSMILLLLVEVGFLGLIIFLPIYFYLLFSYKQVKKKSQLLLPIFLSLFSVILHSLMSSQFAYNINVMSVFWILVAIYEFLKTKNNLIIEGEKK